MPTEDDWRLFIEACWAVIKPKVQAMIDEQFVRAGFHRTWRNGGWAWDPPEGDRPSQEEF